MIEDIAARIDPKLWKESGKVFYSGRAAFSGRASVYVMGFNPGDNPKDPVTETVRDHTRHVLSSPEKWSAYCDEKWKRSQCAGDARLQRQVRHLLCGLGLDPRCVPASNLIFVRSLEAKDLGKKEKQLVEMCWPVHQAVLDKLCPIALICFGFKTGEKVRELLGEKQHISSFPEQSGSRPQCHAWKTPTDLIVFNLRHPSRWNDWRKPDPTCFISQYLRTENSN
jgi:hypothetical protein